MGSGEKEKTEEKRERYIPAPGTYEPAITLKNVSISYTTMQKTSIKQMLRRKKRPQKENFEAVEALKEIAAHKDMLVYLLSYFFYIDGVNTIIHMSTTYGDMLGLDSTAMMLALLMVQMLGLPFCLLYIRLSSRFGARAMVGFGIGVYMFTCVFGFFMHSASGMSSKRRSTVSAPQRSSMAATSASVWGRYLCLLMVIFDL